MRAFFFRVLCYSMSMKPNWLIQLFEHALQKLQLPMDRLIFEYPNLLEHGDYATNIALTLAKDTGKKPHDLAQDIIAHLPSHAWIDSVTVAGPGFINIHLAPHFFEAYLTHKEDKKNLPEYHTLHSGKKILVEHSSPNLFKPFHIGHFMNNAIGESLVRLMRASGADVRTMSFPSDISLGIAKAIFVLLENKYEITIENLGHAYVEGTQRYEADESIHVRVKEIADHLYASTPSPECELFDECKKFNIAYFEKIVARLGSHFDRYIFESEAGKTGKELVLNYTPNIFTHSEGALVYIPDESKKHLRTAVFINSQGNPTYEAKDLGLLKMKFEQETPDMSLFVTDYQQVPHFQIVLDAAAQIDHEWAEKSIHIPHGRMSFKGQKMSSRLGGVPLITDLIDLVSEEVRTRSNRELDPDLVDAIAIGALKFTILRAKPGQNINFDPDTSLSFEGDSGPYLQYTHARICSMLEKAKHEGIVPKYSHGQGISRIEKIIYRYESVVLLAIQDYAPHHLVTYALSLAQTFNTYYAEHQFIDSSNNILSAHRLYLAEVVQKTLAHALDLLGIHTPKEM